MLGLRTRLLHLCLLAAGATGFLLAPLFASAVRGDDAPADGPTERDPITISADVSHDWQAEESAAHVWLLRGHCRIEQGDTTLASQKMVLWVQQRGSQTPRTQIRVYLEGDVHKERPGGTRNEQILLADLVTQAGVTFQIRKRVAGEDSREDPLFLRAVARRRAGRKPAVQQTQLVVPSETDIGPELRSVPVEPNQGIRRIRIFKRSALPYNVSSFESTNTTPPEQVWILSGGVNVIIDGMEGLGTINLAADRMVIWTQAAGSGDFSDVTFQSGETPLQIYLEDNIIARQGENVLRASRAFYDAREDRAILLNAEMKVRMPNLPFALRVRADRLRQLSRSSFHAQNAWASTSQFGKPGYRLQSSDVFLEERIGNPFTVGGSTQVDPETGLPEVESTMWATSLNTKFIVEDAPLFYTPYLTAPAQDPGIPLRKITAAQDRIFGTQVYTVWNLFKLLNVDAPPGTRLDLLADYLSERGPGVGLSGEYKGEDLFGIPGEHSGTGLGYYQHESGTDNLGRDRRDLEPADENRGRMMFRHRQELFEDFTLHGEIGYLSDRNFLEQYYEKEFDTGKNNETLLYGKQQRDNWALSVLGRVQLNEFDTTTEWLPKADFHLLSEPLLDGLLSWSSHSSAGLARLDPAEAPTDPTDPFAPLPYVTQAEGTVLMSRHELSAPFSLGPVNFVPYALGEVSYWGDDFNGSELTRAYGSAGVRASVLFWKAFPNVESSVLGLRGLAHKMTFDADYYIADSSEDLNNIPQYNEFEDQAQSRFRNRLLVNTYGGTLPTMFDPRNYAVRSGANHNVSSPYHELVDDQHVLRLGWRHRLQTKTGPLDNQRIKDWMTLDLGASFFPNPDRDNFGEDFGLLSARYAWNVGDRTTLFANSLYDTFDDGQQLWDVGLVSQRSTRGSVYLGLRQVKGAGIESQIATASYSYAMSPKWISTLGTAYDLAEGQNRGQSLTITRVGADFLLHIGANYDASKDNAGVAVSLEPRFFPFQSSGTQLGSLLGGG